MAKARAIFEAAIHHMLAGLPPTDELTRPQEEANNEHEEPAPGSRSYYTGKRPRKSGLVPGAGKHSLRAHASSPWQLSS